MTTVVTPFLALSSELEEVLVHEEEPPAAGKTGYSYARLSTRDGADDHGHGHASSHGHEHANDHVHGHSQACGHEHDEIGAARKSGAARKRHADEGAEVGGCGHGEEDEGCGHDHGADGWRKYLPHAHGLQTRLRADKRSLQVALGILVAAFTLQLVGSYVARSSVLRVEAVHSALDGLTVVISLLSVTVAGRAPTARYSYGFARAEVLSALVSVVALALLCLKMFGDAAERLWHVVHGSRATIHVEGDVVFVASAVALCANVFMACVLTRGASRSLNVRALRAHVVADSVENVVLLFAGAVMWVWPAAAVADPVLAMVIVAVIVCMNAGMARQAVEVLMQAAPSGVDVERMRERVGGVSGVLGVRGLHVWTVTCGKDVASVVVDAEGAGEAGREEEIMEGVQEVFRKEGVEEACVMVCGRGGQESG